jgi:hypothetical protein
LQAGSPEHRNWNKRPTDCHLFKLNLYLTATHHFLSDYDDNPCLVAVRLRWSLLLLRLHQFQEHHPPAFGQETSSSKFNAMQMMTDWLAIGKKQSVLSFFAILLQIILSVEGVLIQIVIVKLTALALFALATTSSPAALATLAATLRLCTLALASIAMLRLLLVGLLRIDIDLASVFQSFRHFWLKMTALRQTHLAEQDLVGVLLEPLFMLR